MKFAVNVDYDDEAQVWIATSDDVAGLVLESGSLDALIEKLRYAVPELLELNGSDARPAISIVARRENLQAV